MIFIAAFGRLFILFVLFVCSSKEVDFLKEYYQLQQNTRKPMTKHIKL